MITQEDIDDFMEEVNASRKPPLTVPQMVEIFAETMRQVTDPEMSANLVVEEDDEWYVEYYKWVDSDPTYDPAKELKELADKTYVAYGYARARGWDLGEAVRRVHNNNIDRCVWPNGGVRYRTDGKVLRNPDAPKIDLSDLVK